MAGLVAIFGPDGLDASLSELTKRFPSHAAKRDEWQDDFFAAVRLHHGKVNPAPQPTWDDSGDLCVFMDGHLYDEEAGDRSQGAEVSSSAAVGLRAYQAGPDALAGLNGNFALIIYDKVRRSITLVSDRINTRPLYYFQAGRVLVVASHIAALTGHPRCPKTLSRQALHELILYRQVLSRSTIYTGIQRLEPASIVSFDGQTLSQRPYWRPEFREPDFSRREAPAVLADALRRSAQRRLSRSLRHGVLLSGGLDSRTVLAVAENPLACFTLGPRENLQVQTARVVADLQGAPHRFLSIDPNGFMEHFEESVRLTGGMFGCQHCHFLPVLGTIKQECDVVFVGHHMEGFFRAAFLPSRKLKIGGSSIELPLLAEVNPENLVTSIVHWQKQSFPWKLPMRVLTKAAAAEHETRLEDSVRDRLRNYDPRAGESPLRAWDYLLLRSLAQRHTIPNILCIRSRMDEEDLVRDREILEIFLQMPPHWRQPDSIFRAALKRLSPPLARMTYADTGLPSTVHPYAETAFLLFNKSLRRLRHKVVGQRSATGPEPWLDFDEMLRQVEPLRERVQALPKSDALAACGIYDPAGLESVVAEHLRGKSNLGRFLLILLTVEDWIRQFGAEGSE